MPHKLQLQLVTSWYPAMDSDFVFEFRHKDQPTPVLRLSTNGKFEEGAMLFTVATST